MTIPTKKQPIVPPVAPTNPEAQRVQAAIAALLEKQVHPNTMAPANRQTMAGNGQGLTQQSVWDSMFKPAGERAGLQSLGPQQVLSRSAAGIPTNGTTMSLAPRTHEQWQMPEGDPVLAPQAPWPGLDSFVGPRNQPNAPAPAPVAPAAPAPATPAPMPPPTAKPSAGAGYLASAKQGVSNAASGVQDWMAGVLKPEFMNFGKNLVPKAKSYWDELTGTGTSPIATTQAQVPPPSPSGAYSQAKGLPNMARAREGERSAVNDLQVPQASMPLPEVSVPLSGPTPDPYATNIEPPRIDLSQWLQGGGVSTPMTPFPLSPEQQDATWPIPGMSEVPAGVSAPPNPLYQGLAPWPYPLPPRRPVGSL